jgi:hypothetical protein
MYWQEVSMRRTDRAVRRASQHLAAGEALITSAIGLEAEGRRRQVVLLTDRRVLLVGFRGEEPVVLPREGCVGEYDTIGGLLSIWQGDQQLQIRDVDGDVAARLMTLLRRHRSTLGRRAGSYRHVRVLES